MSIVDFVARSYRPVCRDGQRPGVRCREARSTYNHFKSPRFIIAVVSLSLIALCMIVSLGIFLYRRRSFKMHLRKNTANRGAPGHEGGVIFDSADRSGDDENKPMLKKLRLGDRLKGKNEESVATDPFSDKYKNNNPHADSPFDENATPRPSFQSVGYAGGGDTRTSLDQGYQYGQDPYMAVPNNTH